MKQQEAILQSECFKWVWNTYPQTRRMIFHIPNGGNRSIIEGMKFKAMGVIAGVPDMCWLHNGEAIFFEFKSETGKLSMDQVIWHDIAKKNGFQIYVVSSFERFKSIIENNINL